MPPMGGICWCIMCGGGCIPPRYGEDISWGTVATGGVDLGVKAAADALSLNSFAFGFNPFFAGAAAVVVFAASSVAPPVETADVNGVDVSFVVVLAGSLDLFPANVVVTDFASELVSLPFAAGAVG